MIFRIWNHASTAATGNLVYSEQQNVTITDGEFSVLIGNGTAVSGSPLGFDESPKGPSGSFTIATASVFGGATRYLGITVDDGNSGTTDPEITPRQQLVTSAYAFRAKYAESVGSNGVNSLFAADNGFIGIGTANPGARLEVAGNVRAGGSSVANASFVLANSAGNHVGTVGAAAGAGAFSSDAAANDVVFRADAGKLLFQTGSGASAILIDSSNRVGIGITSPSAKLHVGGAIAASASATTHSQGAYLEWNKVGTSGSTYLLNHKGLGSGGIFFGEVDNADTVTERMRIDGTGNVGIGATSPGAKLEVVSPDAVNTAFISHTGGTGTQPALRVKMNAAAGLRNVIQAENSAGSVFVVRDDGRVGVGTTMPASSLDVRAAAPAITVGTPAGTEGALYFGNTAHGVKRSYSGVNDVGLYTTGGDVYLSGSGTSNGFFVVKNNGSVGIGTNTPSEAKLLVGGYSGSQTFGTHMALVNTGLQGPSSAGPHTVADISIHATNAIHAAYIRVISDARIKRIQGRSNGALDLALLAQIEITNYTHRDTALKGQGLQKKLIGQQVESVFPQAVVRTTDVVPDIYQKAAAKDGWVALTTDLKVGERVRLVDTKAESVYEVLEVQPGRFRTAYAEMRDDLFVYGREVKDFRVVDYEAVAMLNVSATQELARENAALKKRVAELEGRDRDYTAKFAALEKMIQSSATAMAKSAAARAAASEQQ